MMPLIDPALLRQLEGSPGSAVSVLITCEDDCSAAIKALSNSSVTISGTDTVILGSFQAKVMAQHLPLLQALPGVIAIEPDEEASALD